MAHPQQPAGSGLRWSSLGRWLKFAQLRYLSTWPPPLQLPEMYCASSLYFHSLLNLVIHPLLRSGSLPQNNSTYFFAIKRQCIGGEDLAQRIKPQMQLQCKSP
jgi:hypothetical protein